MSNQQTMIKTAGKPVLVIGSNSFSGASFVGHLLNQGIDVIGVSRSEQPDAAFLPYRWGEANAAFTFFAYDINHHLDEIMALVNKHQPAIIVNFAAQSMVGQSWQAPEDWFQTNSVATAKLFNALRQVDFLDRYVHISTPEVYGSCAGFVKEHKNYSPSTPYAISRAAGDMMLHAYHQTFDFPVVFTRAANVYGEGQQLYRIIPRAILYSLLGNTLPLHGGGHSERSFIHIDDVSRATWLIAEQGQPGEIYHISTTNTVSIRHLVEQVSEQMGVPFEQLCEVTDDRPGKDQAYLLDSTKVRDLGWQDEVTLSDGISRTIDWVKRNLDTLKTQPHDYIHKK